MRIELVPSDEGLLFRNPDFPNSLANRLYANYPGKDGGILSLEFRIFKEGEASGTIILWGFSSNGYPSRKGYFLLYGLPHPEIPRIHKPVGIFEEYLYGDALRDYITKSPRSYIEVKGASGLGATDGARRDRERYYWEILSRIRTLDNCKPSAGDT